MAKQITFTQSSTGDLFSALPPCDSFQGTVPQCRVYAANHRARPVFMRAGERIYPKARGCDRTAEMYRHKLAGGKYAY